MRRETRQKTVIIRLLPSFGIAVFIGLFIILSTLYPGGSQADPSSVGFSWVHNYWCNLTDYLAVNGQVNPARPYAILASFVLSMSLLIFLFQFANTLVKNKVWKNVIKIGGFVSMLCAMFIFTKYHNFLIGLSTVFGLTATVGIVKTIYESSLKLYKVAGVFCICLLALNNLIYYSGIGIEVLPLLQKITFCSVFGWVVGLNYKAGLVEEPAK